MNILYISNCCINKTIQLLERKTKYDKREYVIGMRSKTKYLIPWYIYIDCEREMTTVGRERVGVNANSCCLSLLDNRVLRLSNFSLSLSLCLSLTITTPSHSLSLSLSLSFTLGLYTSLLYSHHLGVLPYLSLRVSTPPLQILPASSYTHTNMYIIFICIPVVI